MTHGARGRIIHRLGDLIMAHLDDFALLGSLDNGKPYAVAKVADVPLAADLFHYMSGWATKIEDATIPTSGLDPSQYLAFTLREPVGVCGQIIPWNFPLLMAAWKVGPVLASGCTTVLKPAEQTPLSALLLGELAMEAGLPPGVLNIVTGFGDAGAALAAHPDVDKVAFTGSTEVGREIVKAAAGNLKKVSLELGGKSPNVVYADADLDKAIAGSANAIFFNQGECCVAGSRLYVEEAVYDEVVSGIREQADAIKVGDGLDPATTMGPLVSQEQFDRVTGYIRSGREDGATIFGGDRVGDRGYFVAPTVLTGTREDMTAVREEIFGPVVAAAPFNADLLTKAETERAYTGAMTRWSACMRESGYHYTDPHDAKDQLIGRYRSNPDLAATQRLEIAVAVTDAGCATRVGLPTTTESLLRKGAAALPGADLTALNEVAAARMDSAERATTLIGR